MLNIVTLSKAQPHDRLCSEHEPCAARRSERQRAAGDRLGTTRATFPVSDSPCRKPNEGRRHRYEMRDGLRNPQVMPLERVRKCGAVPVSQRIALMAGHGGAGYAGLATCGSVWACPVCAAKISAHRRDELARVVQVAVGLGFKVSMLTLTQRHHAGQDLAELWASLQSGWNAVTSGRRWQEFCAQLGVQGWVKAVEVTHGSHGWHVHVHVLVISKQDPTSVDTKIRHRRKQGRRRTPYPEEVQRPEDFIAERWSRGLRKRGVDFIAGSGGLDWQTADSGDEEALGRYVAKMNSSVDGLANEATLGGFKKARRGNRTPFQILEDFLDTGSETDLRLWRTYVSASHGRKALTWSKGLRDWAGMESEMSDEQVAAQDQCGEAVALFDHDAWRQIRTAGAAFLLDELELHGSEGVYAWLKKRRIHYEIPLVPWSTST
uniref:Rep n=1 Tax=Cutibacterium granulosum TaxID=33011 RepID=Q8GDF1_9ACTN|nr:Rep [Cutibacterium granulosum]